ncbi:MAG: proton-conducting transporter membrane subunit [Micropruina sp.]
MQAALFLVAGLIERVGGSTSMDRLGGLASTAPILGVLFFVPAMNLAGIPPLSGFVGKLGLLLSGVEVGTPLAWSLVVGSVLTSLLTLYAVAKVWGRVFWGTPMLGPLAPGEGPEDLEDAGRMPGVMIGATAALVGLGLTLTFVAGPLYDYVDRAAFSVLGTEYLEAVLSGVGR